MSKTLVVSQNIYPESERNLINLGFSLLKFPAIPRMESAVSAHPDMFIAQINKQVFCDSAVHNYFTNFDRDYTDKYKFIMCDRGVDIYENTGYPYNIGFNCVNVGDYLICNEKYTCKTILEYAKTNNIKIVDVKQGYAKCSTCVVADNAIITEDESIAAKAASYGIDVLKIEKGFIKLDGYEYGFIGGCSGLIETNLLAFNGNVSLHPEYTEISCFCGKYGVDVISLCDRELMDIGTIIRIQ